MIIKNKKVKKKVKKVFLRNLSVRAHEKEEIQLKPNSYYQNATIGAKMATGHFFYALQSSQSILQGVIDFE